MPTTYQVRVFSDDFAGNVDALPPTQIDATIAAGLFTDGAIPGTAFTPTNYTLFEVGLPVIVPIVGATGLTGDIGSFTADRKYIILDLVIRKGGTGGGVNDFFEVEDAANGAGANILTANANAAAGTPLVVTQGAGSIIVASGATIHFRRVTATDTSVVGFLVLIPTA